MSLSQSIPVLEQEIKYLRRDLERARDDKQQAEDDLKAYLLKSEVVSTAREVAPSEAIAKLSSERDQALRERDQANRDKQKVIAEKEQAAEGCTTMCTQVEKLLARISEIKAERDDAQCRVKNLERLFPDHVKHQSELVTQTTSSALTTKQRETTVEDIMNPSPELQARLQLQMQRIKQEQSSDKIFKNPQQVMWFPKPTAEETERKQKKRAAASKALVLATLQRYKDQDEENARKLKVTAHENAEGTARETPNVVQKKSSNEPFGNPQQVMWFPKPTAEETECKRKKRAAASKALVLATLQRYKDQDEENARKLKVTAHENAEGTARETSNVVQKKSTSSDPWAPKANHTDEPGGASSIAGKRKAGEALMPSADAPKKRMTVRQPSRPS